MSGLDGFQGIDPPLIIRALDALGLHADGRLLALNSYENRVLQVYLEDGGRVVAKVYRPGRWTDDQILEEHGYARELHDEDIPVIPARPLARIAGDDFGVDCIGSPPTVAVVEQGAVRYRISVSDFAPGRSPDLEDPDVLRWVGRFLGRMHRVGSRRPFAHRSTLSVAERGDAAVAQVLASGHLPPEGAPAWEHAARQAVDAAREVFGSLPDVRLLRIHGDFHAGNLLWRAEGPHVVDLDDACNGPAVQDLWMLAAGDQRTALSRQLEAVLEGYRMFMPFDERELRLVEPLRTLRMVHHSAWLARRWHDPAFPAAFPWFGTPAYWDQQTVQLREQLEAD